LFRPSQAGPLRVSGLPAGISGPASPRRARVDRLKPFVFCTSGGVPAFEASGPQGSLHVEGEVQP